MTDADRRTVAAFLASLAKGRPNLGTEPVGLALGSKPATALRAAIDALNAVGWDSDRAPYEPALIAGDRMVRRAGGSAEHVTLVRELHVAISRASDRRPEVCAVLTTLAAA